MKILKQHSLASLYLILFIVVQTIYSAVFLLHRITYDVDFTDKIAEVFSEYYTEDYE